MRHVFHFLLNTLFPPHHDVVCAGAVTEEHLVSLYTFEETEGVYTALPYRNPEVRALIRANKFHADRHARQLLSAVLFETLLYVLDERSLELFWKNAILLPRPSSKKKRRTRGYNQIEKIIERLPKETSQTLRYIPELLERHDRTSQARIPKLLRTQNVRSAFFVPEKYTHVLHESSVIIIDDVTESGATMQDAMRALKEAGVQNVIGIALAK